jgi:hypothetical protein
MKIEDIKCMGDNLEIITLKDNRFYDCEAGVVRIAGVNYLVITEESQRLTNESAIAILEELKKIGIRIEIDSDGCMFFKSKACRKSEKQLVNEIEQNM